MRFSTKVLLMPALALLAFLVLLVVNEGTGRSNERLMARVRTGYVPALMTSHAVEDTLQAIQRRLQDAVAAKDPAGLAEAKALRDRLLRLLEDGRANSAFDPEELEALRSAFSEYCRLLCEVSARMIRGEYGDSLEAGLVELQARHRKVRDRLEALARRQEEAMSRAFRAAGDNQRKSTGVMSSVIALALLSLGTLSAVLTRAVRRTLNHAVEVADRLSRGDLSTVIESHTKDEFGRLLGAMKRMMDYLQRMAAMADRIAGEDAPTAPSSTPEGGRLASAFAKMAQAEARTRHLFESVGAIVWRFDPATGRFLFVSQEAEKLLGHSTRRWLDDPGFWLDHVHPQDRERAQAANRRAAEEGSQEVEYRMIAADGRAVWLHGFVRPVHGGGGAGELGGVFLDITHRRRVEDALAQRVTEIQATTAALKASEERYRTLFENNPQPMWVYDTRTLRFLAVNESALGHYGYSREEFLEMTIADIRPEEDAAAVRERVARAPEGLQRSGVWRHRKKDGTLIDVEVSSHGIRFDEWTARLVLAADVTERRRLEEQLRQSQKMEAVGRLAGGVAHDFNNLLSVIIGYGQLLQRRLPEDSPLQRHMTEILKAGERAANLTGQLLAFSRKQVLQPRVLDLNDVVTDMEKMLRRLIGEDIELRTALQSGLGHVKADPGQLEQVIMNLVVNARDAMPGGGKLSLETQTVPLGESYAHAHNCQSGPHAMLAVSDTGCGMDSATMTRIFEPFFTTKEAGKGTGLGLATVYGIVKQSGGHINVYSEVGRGTTFKVYLPLAGNAGKSAQAVPEAPLEQGTETLLLVEDEEALREMAREILVEAGYDVLDSGSPAQALALASSCVKPIDLVLTDVVMPGMSGRDLAERLTASRPLRGVVYMSGYTDDAIGQHGVLDPGVHFLQKPFTSEGLLRKIRAALESQPAGVR